MFRKNNGRIDIFDREYFEDNLPCRVTDKSPLWHRYIADDEYQYLIDMDDPDGVMIIIRSSVSSLTDQSATTGQDSIRLWLVGADGAPLGHKLDAYTTREAGWEKRMWGKLKSLRKLRIAAGNCPVCKKPRKIWRVKKKTSNYYKRLFAKCGCREENPSIWLS